MHSMIQSFLSSPKPKPNWKRDLNENGNFYQNICLQNNVKYLAMMVTAIYLFDPRTM